MDFIIEVPTRHGLLCEKFATYAEARRRVDSVPAADLLGMPLIFRALPDGSQRLVRDDGKPLQWHRLEEDNREVMDEPVPLSDDLPAGDGRPLIRPVERATDDIYDSVPVQRIVFVCVENSNRSQMAEAFARIHGGAHVDACSAGSRPSGQVNPRAIEAMREKGYDLAQHQSRSVAELPPLPFDVAVTMGCGDACPLLQAQRREDWNIPDPRDLPADEFRAVRDLIEQKVIDLLARLQT
jgi:arsenate reductase (thioredoxin)